MVMDSVAEMHWKQHYVDRQTQNSDQSSWYPHLPEKTEQTSTKHDISSVYKDFKSTNLNHSKILPTTKNTQTPDILMKFFAERL
jgi:hypothetical protein